jgi:hypothetical protein
MRHRDKSPPHHQRHWPRAVATIPNHLASFVVVGPALDPVESHLWSSHRDSRWYSFNVSAANISAVGTPWGDTTTKLVVVENHHHHVHCQNHHPDRIPILSRTGTKTLECTVNLATAVKVQCELWRMLCCTGILESATAAPHSRFAHIR